MLNKEADTRKIWANKIFIIDKKLLERKIRVYTDNNYEIYISRHVQ